MKKLFYPLFITALMFISGCGDSLYQVYNDFTGPVESVAVPETKSIVVNTSEKIKVSVYPSMTENKNVTWASADDLIASVDADGVVTAHLKGGEYLSTTITVTTEEGGFTAQCLVTVVPVPIPITSWVFPNSEETISVTGQMQLLPETVPGNATNTEKTWKSSDNSVVTVDSDGLVSGIKAGTAVITVTSTHWNVSGTCTVNVISGTLVTSVTLNNDVYSTTKKESVQLTATVLPANATKKTLVWNSSKPSVATVDSSGLVSIIAAGNAAISASTTDGSNITKFFNITATGYTVTYNGNHNSTGTAPVDSKTYLEGQSFPTKTAGDLAYYDRDMMEWNKSEDGSGTGSGTVGGDMTMASGGMTLYAIWQAYALKDRGPAGGWIFYDSSSYGSKGWRYLEAASSDYNIEQCWNIGGNYHTTGATNTAIGTGKANTALIITAQGTEVNAARVSTYERDGYSDWFLPSIDEIYTMWFVLKNVSGFGWGGVYGFDDYWTSTEVDSINALEFGIMQNATGGTSPKNNSARIRPVRSF